MNRPASGMIANNNLNFCAHITERSWSKAHRYCAQRHYGNRYADYVSSTASPYFVLPSWSGKSGRCLSSVGRPCSQQSVLRRRRLVETAPAVVLSTDQDDPRCLPLSQSAASFTHSRFRTPNKEPHCLWKGCGDTKILSAMFRTCA